VIAIDEARNFCVMYSLAVVVPSLYGHLTPPRRVVLSWGIHAITALSL
jgi:hypothetical protein